MLKKKLGQVIAVATIAAGFVVVGCGEDVDGDVSTPGEPDAAKPKTTETKEEDKGFAGPPPDGKGPVGPEGLPPVPGK
ncbi:MAG: hypothetical protein HOH86_07870 [Verrucomicrobiales bacterium]|jgi:hypothetical protein|nr:hypothetical protein [Verrucomicrobiales bacterium]